MVIGTISIFEQGSDQDWLRKSEALVNQGIPRNGEWLQRQEPEWVRKKFCHRSPPGNKEG